MMVCECCEELKESGNYYPDEMIFICDDCIDKGNSDDSLQEVIEAINTELK